MTKKTRYFIYGSVAFLVVGLSVGLVAYYGGFSGIAFSQASGPSELRYVPRDAVVVAYANVHDVMASSFRQKIRELEPPEKERGQQEFRDATGIDIENDIDHVIAWVGSAENPDRNSVVLAQGRFDEPRVTAFVTGHGGTLETYKGRKLLTHAGHGDAPAVHPSMGLAFLQANLVAVGSVAAIRRVVDLEAGGGEPSVTENDELMKMIRTVDNGNAWAVGRFDALASKANLPDAVTRQLPPIRWFAASGRVNGGVSGRLSVEATDEQAAATLRKVVEGFMALAQLQAGSNQGLQAFMSSVQLDANSDARTVSVSFSLPPELFDALKTLQGRGRGDLPVR
jgi:hypothetical protein